MYVEWLNDTLTTIAGAIVLFHLPYRFTGFRDGGGRGWVGGDNCHVEGLMDGNVNVRLCFWSYIL